MIKKIIIDNFMAHEHTELELGPGVTALTGPNNTGKSAIVEALRYLTTNPAPSNCIRHGAREAKVSVELNDGTLVTWARTKRAPRYEITPPDKDEPEEPFRKMGRGVVPDEIRELLKLDMVELETGRKIDLHVGNQRKPVFLLDNPDSDTAAFFAASTESAHLLAMQNRLKRRTQDSKREERDLETRIKGVEEEMDTLEALPDIATQVETAREFEMSAQRLQAEIPALESLIQAQNALSKTHETCTRSATILKETKEPPKLNEVKQLNTEIVRLEKLNRKLLSARSTVSTLANLSPLPQTFDTASMDRLCGHLRTSDTQLRKAETTSHSLTALSEPPTTENTAQLSGFIDQILAIGYRRKRLDRWNDILRKVAEPPNIQTDETLAGLVADIRTLEGRKATTETTLATLEKKLETVRENITNVIDRLGCCPTCGADLNTEAIIDRGCRHDS